jgi:glycosyltransferase involved in cell wall biosynthesis
VRNVLFVIGSLGYGGAAQQLTLLAGHLPRDRFRARVAVLGGPAPWAGALAASGVPVDVLGWRRAFDLRPFLGLRTAARRCRPDVLHAWGPAALRAAALATGAVWSRGVRLFAGGLLPPAGGLATVDRHLLRRATAVIALGPAEAQRYERTGVDPARIAVVPPAAPARETPAPSGKGPPVPAGARVLLGIGPLEPYKGFREAVWAMDILRHVYPDLHLVLAGSGSDRPRVERFARDIHVSGHVHFTGPCDDLGPLLERAELVWVPSLADRGRGAALEAMAAGRPVVASRWPGLAEVVEDGVTGRLVPPDDKAALARQTRALLEDPGARRRLGEAGRRRAAEHFPAAGLAGACARLYEPTGS